MTYEEWNNDSVLRKFPCDVCYNHRQELYDPLLCESCAENDFCHFYFDDEELKDISLEVFKKNLFKDSEYVED